MGKADIQKIMPPISNVAILNLPRFTLLVYLTSKLLTGLRLPVVKGATVPPFRYLREVLKTWLKKTSVVYKN